MFLSVKNNRHRYRDEWRKNGRDGSLVYSKSVSPRDESFIRWGEFKINFSPRSFERSLIIDRDDSPLRSKSILKFAVIRGTSEHPLFIRSSGYFKNCISIFQFKNEKILTGFAIIAKLNASFTLKVLNILLICEKLHNSFFFCYYFDEYEYIEIESWKGRTRFTLK